MLLILPVFDVKLQTDLMLKKKFYIMSYVTLRAVKFSSFQFYF